jgi:hypothetical protein
MQLLNWQNQLNLETVLHFLSLMPLAWIVQNWYTSPVSIPFFIGTVIVLMTAYISYKKPEFR